MRFLNKITFINSASIKYAEINLDGNVHFIGTQGVGKSTLLRAILFFYNADKTKLGISREKKNFDSYYFPYQNSYIIFEVVKDHKAFSVVAFKTNGRVAFRFVDTSYKKRYFINDEGATFESWDKIRAILKQETTFSKIITNYEEYRNILYGNSYGLDPDLKKYAILESKQYQNIPRTIQNVFLNTKLDAEFIKETIIKSLNEDILKIDLSTYANNHFKDFETELNDIQLWSKVNKQGEILIRLQAEEVAKAYRSLSILDKEKIDIAKKLGWSIQSIQNKLPHLKLGLDKELVKHNAIKRQINQLEEGFSERSQEIKTQIGIIKKDIRKANAKRKEYQSIHIDDLVIRVAQKLPLEIELQGLLEEKSLLTSQFTQIEKKYQALIDQLTNQTQKLSNEKATKQNQLESAFLTVKDELNSEYQNLVSELRASHIQDTKQIDTDLQTVLNSIFELNKQGIELRHKTYFKNEVESYNQERNILTQQKHQAQQVIEESERQIGLARKDGDFKLEHASAQLDLQIREYGFEKDKITQQIISIQNKLDSSKGSLYDWLNTNVNNWSETIGKVIDVDHVLFKTDLDPKYNPELDQSIFGLQIDLAKINKPLKTIEEYMSELQDFQDIFNEIDKSITDLNVKKGENEKQLKREYNAKIVQLKEDISTKEIEVERILQKAQSIEVQIQETQSKAERKKSEDTKHLDLKISELKMDEAKLRKQLETAQVHINDLLKTKENDKEKRIAHAYENYQEEIEQFNISFGTTYNQYETRINELKTEQHTELNDEGANTKRINQLDMQLKKIKEELHFIEKNRDKVAEYKKDKKELLDHSDSFKAKKSEFEQNLIQETQAHELQKGNLLDENKKNKLTIDQFEDQIKGYNTNLEKYATFQKSEPHDHVKSHIDSFSTEHEHAFEASKLIEDINQNFYTVIKQYQDLQASINTFTGNFLEDNIFKFKTKFNTKQEYLQFAEMLKEFIDEDKISMLESRVNERFTHIIRQIGKETTGILSKEEEIHNIINKVNQDFFSKNFVGAIKSMQIRIVPSSNKIMRLLMEIKAFNDEHNRNLGETDLFTTKSKSDVNSKAIKLVKTLIKEMQTYKSDVITLSDSFGLEFRILENDNDTGWVEKLTNVGSEGTDILVKAMINIMLLNVFKDNASKRIKNFKLHCMMDEIGKLHPTNVKGILKFANDRNILLINSSPTSYNATDYKYTYLLSKDYNNVTRAKRLVKKTPTLLDI